MYRLIFTTKPTKETPKRIGPHPTICGALFTLYARVSPLKPTLTCRISTGESKWSKPKLNCASGGSKSDRLVIGELSKGRLFLIIWSLHRTPSDQPRPLGELLFCPSTRVVYRGVYTAMHALSRALGALLAAAILLLAICPVESSLINPTLVEVHKFAPLPGQLEYSFFAEHPPVLSLDEKWVLLLSTYARSTRYL